MNRIVKLGLAAASVVLLSGCAMTPVMPPRGILYTEQKAPLFQAQTTGTLKGKASATNVLMLFGWGDCSLKTAAQRAGITKIKNVDYEYTNVFIFYQDFTVVVYGEKEDGQPQNSEHGNKNPNSATAPRK